MSDLRKLEQQENLEITNRILSTDLNPTNLSQNMISNSSSYATAANAAELTPPLPPPVPIMISFENYSSSESRSDNNTQTPSHPYPHDDYHTAAYSNRLDDGNQDHMMMLTAAMPSMNHVSNFTRPQMLNFSAASASGHYCNMNSGNIGTGATSATRTPLQAQDHLLAERKRREKLSQLFITLSKLVPGLKKLDKASLLEDAINYLKSLKERVRILEELAASETIIIINSKSNNKGKAASALTEIKDINDDDYCNYWMHEEEEGTEPPAVEIKARILKGQEDVLIKIYCKKQQKKGAVMGLVSKIPTEVEKIMNLRAIDMRVIPFGVDEALDITILAKHQQQHQKKQSDGTVLKDIVGHLQTLWFSPPAWGST